MIHDSNKPFNVGLLLNSSTWHLIRTVSDHLRLRSALYKLIQSCIQHHRFIVWNTGTQSLELLGKCFRKDLQDSCSPRKRSSGCFNKKSPCICLPQTLRGFTTPISVPNGHEAPRSLGLFLSSNSWLARSVASSRSTDRLWEANAK